MAGNMLRTLKFMKRKKTGTSDEKKLRQREELAFATSLSHVGC
jgi:hypothetical protein